MTGDLWTELRQVSCDYGQRLRELRVDAGLSMHDLCLAVNIAPDPPLISRIEHGHTIPMPVYAERLTAWMVAQTGLQTSVSSAAPLSAVSIHPDPHTLIRAEDGDTSYRAACSVNRANAAAIHEWIIERLGNTDFGLTHAELFHQFRSRQTIAARRLRSSESGLRTRVSELVRGGVVRDSGRRRILKTGRTGIVWELTDEHRQGGA